MDINQIMALANNPKLAEILNDPKVVQLVLQNPQSLIDFANGRLSPAAQPEVQATGQSKASVSALAPEGMLLQLLMEFEAQDPEKRLSASLSKFSRFVQSRVNTSTEQQ